MIITNIILLFILVCLGLIMIYFIGDTLSKAWGILLVMDIIMIIITIIRLIIK